MNCQKKKILVVDDDKDIQQIIKDRLEDENFQVVFADDGNAALKIAEKEVPDLIILDIIMQGMDGYTCLKQMRLLPKTKDIPVLMLSGKEEELVRDLFVFHKISGYIEKPFELDGLVKKVNEILKL